MMPLVPVLPNLTKLDATGTGITDSFISELERCPKLQFLLAKECVFGLPDGSHLHVDSGMSDSQKAALKYGVTEDSVKQLADKLPYAR